MAGLGKASLDAINALKTGGDIVSLSESDSVVDINNPDMVEGAELSGDSFLDDQLGTIENQDTITDEGENSLSEATDSKDAKSEQPSDENVEVITVTDHRGRKKKLTIDYSDRDKIKRAHELMAGARKWQAEKDSIAKEYSSYKDAADSKVKNWDAISKSYDEQGIEGLINLIEGDGGFDKLIESKIREREFRKNATPEELDKYEASLKMDNTSKEIEKLRKELEETKSLSTKEREAAEAEAVKATVFPIFDKYRFSGKLGNEADEHKLDKMLWNSAKANLDDYEEGEITPAIIHKEFKKEALLLRRLINKQTDDKVTKVITDKKRETMEHVQSKAMSGYKDSSDATEAKALLQNRNLTGLLQNWGKYGKLFNKQ